MGFVKILGIVIVVMVLIFICLFYIVKQEDGYYGSRRK